jgi:hypothetical protein
MPGSSNGEFEAFKATDENARQPPSGVSGLNPIGVFQQRL